MSGDLESVRGTNSRGAKDVAALGKVTFQSIADDGRYHRCEIEGTKFSLYQSEAVTAEVRTALGIRSGTGTLVTVDVEGRARKPFPSHEKLADGVANLVVLRDILSDSRRTVVLSDLNKDRRNTLRSPIIDGRERVKHSFEVPGYPKATAKLVIKRSATPFSRERDRFRKGGILIKSKRAIHEATLFDNRLDYDPHAAWFYGRLSCPHLDDLVNDYDNRLEAGGLPSDRNPSPVIDPMRRQGLMRDHPFVDALFGEALKQLRPLVEDERRRAEGQRTAIESQQTKRRLKKLEQAAAEFMEEKQDDPDPVRDPDTTDATTRLKEKGFTLNPPFLQCVVGQSHRFWLNVHQEVFPELSEGAGVQIECLTDEIMADRRTMGLEQHPKQEGVLRAIWNVTAHKVTSATGIRVRVGSIVAEVSIEVLATEADRYRSVETLMFAHKTYRVIGDGKGKKRVALVAPISLVSEPTAFELECSDRRFKITGPRILQPEPRLGIARATITVRVSDPEATGTLCARIGDLMDETELVGLTPKGSGIKIKIENEDFTNQRYSWRSNVLAIAARHPSLRRYLGPATENFPGQESRHFRVLLAEIVADAVCSKIMERREINGFYDEMDCDFNLFSAELGSLVTEFAPLAHRLQLADGDI
jgi:hypothetical protein